jgi:hypothetical protein
MTDQEQSLLLLTLGEVIIAIPRDDVVIVRVVADMLTLTSDNEQQSQSMYSLGWIEHEQQSYPVYALQDDFSCKMTLNVHDRFVICLHHYDKESNKHYYYALLSGQAEQYSLSVKQIIYPLLPLMMIDKTPLMGLFSDQDKLIMLSDSKMLSQFLIHQEK